MKMTINSSQEANKPLNFEQVRANAGYYEYTNKPHLAVISDGLDGIIFINKNTKKFFTKSTYLISPEWTSGPFIKSSSPITLTFENE